MEQKKHQKLITIDFAFEEVYINIHADQTKNEVVNSARINADDICFALTPEEALELAKLLVDAVFVGKSKPHNEQES